MRRRKEDQPEGSGGQKEGFQEIFDRHGLTAEERSLTALVVNYFSQGVREYFTGDVDDSLDTLEHWLNLQDMATKMHPNIVSALVDIYKPLDEILREPRKPSRRRHRGS